MAGSLHENERTVSQTCYLFIASPVPWNCHTHMKFCVQ